MARTLIARTGLTSRSSHLLCIVALTLLTKTRPADGSPLESPRHDFSVPTTTKRRGAYGLSCGQLLARVVVISGRRDRGVGVCVVLRRRRAVCASRRYAMGEECKRDDEQERVGEDVHEEPG